jgi:hypothetical protein
LLYILSLVIIMWNATNSGETMTNFFLKNNCIKHISGVPSPFLMVLWEDIVEAHKWIETEKKSRGDDFYNLSMI